MNAVFELLGGIKTAIEERVRDPLVAPYIVILLVWNWRAIYVLKTTQEPGAAALQAAFAEAVQGLNTLLPARGPGGCWLVLEYLWIYAMPLVILSVYWAYLWKVRPRLVRIRASHDEAAHASRLEAEKTDNQQLIKTRDLENLQDRQQALESLRHEVHARMGVVSPAIPKAQRYRVLHSQLALDERDFCQVIDTTIGVYMPNSGQQFGWIVRRLAPGWYLVALQGAVEPHLQSEVGTCLLPDGMRVAITRGNLETCAAAWLPLTTGHHVLVGSASAKRSVIPSSDWNGRVVDGDFT